jgi:2-oxoisovalerate dehydrogenase E1 component beta subunit
MTESNAGNSTMRTPANANAAAERAQHDDGEPDWLNASADGGPHALGVGGAEAGPQRLSNVEAVRLTLQAAMRADERVLLLGEDIAARGNVFLITTGFLQEFGKRRVIDMPLAEASIVGVAVGMAMQGLRPIAEIQFADFIYPAFNQIVGEAAKTRYRSNGDYSCPLVIRTPYGGGVRGALSHSVSIEALFYHVPGLKIVAPSTPRDIKGLLTAAIEDPDPVLFLEHKKTYRSVKGDVPSGHFTIPIGRADVKRPGTQATVVSYGYNLHQALDAAEQLASDGLSIEVIDLRSIRPMDKTTILTSVRKTRKLLIIHEDNKFGGIGAEISAMVAEEALFDLDAPIRRLCGPDVPAMGYALPLEEAFMISTERMRAAMRELVAF